MKVIIKSLTPSNYKPSKSEVIRIKRLAKIIKEDNDRVELYRKTQIFWTLQLQFLSMERGSESTYNILYGIYFSPMYVKNKFTGKVKSLMFEVGHSRWTSEDFEYLCTHFTLQLSGLT